MAFFRSKVQMPLTVPYAGQMSWAFHCLLHRNHIIDPKVFFSVQSSTVSIPDTTRGFEPWVSIPMGFEPDSRGSIPRVRTRLLGFDP